MCVSSFIILVRLSDYTRHFFPAGQTGIKPENLFYKLVRFEYKVILLGERLIIHKGLIIQVILKVCCAMDRI